MTRGGKRDRQDSSAPAQVTGIVSVSIFLEDEVDAPNIDRAVREVLDEAGYEIVNELPPELGSWFKSLFARARQEVSGAGLDEVAKKALRAVELEQLQRRQAYVNETNLNAVANLIDKLEKTPAAVILIGSILLVKTSSNTLVRELTVEELRHLEEHPELLTDAMGAFKAFGVNGCPSTAEESGMGQIEL
ncbi:hypothetical protein [Nonomuraea sp. NEAU-A123]|uniref:hypothetical protein n=1 Tax=Nonomuraea sp. NEAU-A123 TaxID=2839649 RepID=UPI001BE4DC04|nr:hypothetical protein [Nonomuraea sp. NEAU-A123]MBT2234926.1 hypothetical protein [Nonomuraea sp. NEAU-A123]